ncbi:McrC family protein [Sulfurimonas sp. SAG-AH-194-C20]|nr:McrC family protein [Sulfurimonas sp. SAG-AH-194-C20]MDF1878400.1 McrC family protein [Sulfurimonas sp. SAG-AH-194-C20]
MNKSISEYGCIYTADKEPKNLNSKFTHQEVTNIQWNELYQYWQDSDDAKKILEFDGHHLKAKSYVGIIQTENLSLEILPKIYEVDEGEEKTREIFIEMLKPLLNINEVQINKADLSVTENRNIYEIFITMFVEYVDTLIHKGLKSQYISKEDNQFFLKGKLKFNEHIKRNYIHKERFYVEFDEYMSDRVENRLLKSTIQLLLKKTDDYENKRKLRQQLFVFDEVQFSLSYEVDIAKINLHRGMEFYKIPLQLAKVFLTHKSFTSMRGKDNVFALLFPMEKVFENYIEFVLNNSKDELGIDKVLVNGSKDEYLLSDGDGDGDGDCKMARLQPDYLLKMKGDRNDIVTDAKWKLIQSSEDDSKGCDKVNISSGDVYQIFSYLHFYDCENTAYLFVPEVNQESFNTFTYRDHKGAKEKYLKIIPINLTEITINNQFEKKYLSIFQTKELNLEQQSKNTK